ncbi:MAG: PQQ-binding-like beta-propeller repeat protein [Gemmataceae bacterium]
MHPRSSILLALVLASMTRAADWPQWRGPDRTGLSGETGLLKAWPKEGPRLAWKVTGLGGGFSTPSFAGGRIYLMGAKGLPEESRAQAGYPEAVLCLDEKDGKEVWATEIGTTAGGHPGPRSTPTIDGDRAYAVSSNGVLACLDAGTGKLLWKKSLPKEFGGRPGSWMYAESPLIDGDRVVCTPGGDKATLVALDKKTGAEVWRSSVTGLSGGKRSYNVAAYSSVLAVVSGGVKQYVQFLSGGVVGVDARTGQLLWHYDRPANGTANCSTPLFKDDSVFAASAYRTGGGRARLVKDGDGFKAEEAYFVEKMQNHHGGMVLLGDHVFGAGNSALLCLEFASGKEVGSARAAGKGSVTYADGHLYHRGEDGTVCLVEATPALKERGRFKQPGRSARPAWAHPVIVNGKLYLRDWDALFCYDVKP